MKTLQETSLFRLLIETSNRRTADVDFLVEINIACNEFADSLSEYCIVQSNDAILTLRALSYTRINLEALQAEIAHFEAGEKCTG